MLEKIKGLAEKFFTEVVGIRRHLHMYPELSFEEKETSAFISQQLTGHGIAHETGWGGYGIVAHIKGGQNSSGKVIAIRADIDALPIMEANDVPYRSLNEGKMHACGHDVHTSSVLGTAFILNEMREELTADYRIIFQPAEEKLPGGASILIKEGVLKNPVPEAIIGQHVHPPLEAGKVGFKSGLFMASADEIFVTIRGKGGHAALPQHNIDTILIASTLILSLQQIVSRRADPTIPTVLSFGKINSEGGATNIIPEIVRLEGTFRTMDEAWRTEAHHIMKKLAEETAAAMGGECTFEILKGYPCLINDEYITRIARQAATDYLGAENVVNLPIRMTAEDFAFYSQEIPSCFYRLGTGNQERGITSSVHTPTFDVDEESLRVSIGLMAYIAILQST